MEIIRAFRRANGLTQDELGEYLGMKKSFISKIENGKEKLPSQKFQKLMKNDRGWDVSMLTQDVRGDYILQKGGHNNIGKVVGGKVEMPAINEEEEKIRQLLLAIERRDLQVNELIQQNKTLVEVIKNLTSK